MAGASEYTVSVDIGDLDEVRTVTHAAVELMKAVAGWRKTLPVHRPWTLVEIELETTFREQLALLGPLLGVSADGAPAQPVYRPAHWLLP